MNPPDTVVIRTLDANGINYRLLPHNEPVFTVEAAAEQRGVIKEEMVKSILLRDRKGKHVMACVTGDARLNPHAVRAFLGEGWGRFSFATAEQIEELLGFVQGAVAPVGLPADIPILFDQGIADCKMVNISSGDPMAGLELATEDLFRVAEAQLAQIAADT
jgi:prolyl-tRNA editing enzyme YbaK/EbsC (Cys-tRNA(Pro) deacylase)